MADQTYSVILPAAGCGLYYHICGYSKEGEIYTVYMQLVDYAKYLDEYIKCTATVNDGYAKLLACEEATSNIQESIASLPEKTESEEASPLFIIIPITVLVALLCVFLVLRKKKKTN